MNPLRTPVEDTTMVADSHSASLVNRRALMSLLLALLALLSFCLGVLPLPLSALLCYPSGLLLGIGALWVGWNALRQIRQRDENGATLAKIGIWVGGLTILFVACALTLAIVLGPYVLKLMQDIWANSHLINSLANPLPFEYPCCGSG